MLQRSASRKPPATKPTANPVTIARTTHFATAQMSHTSSRTMSAPSGFSTSIRTALPVSLLFSPSIAHHRMTF